LKKRNQNQRTPDLGYKSLKKQTNKLAVFVKRPAVMKAVIYIFQKNLRMMVSCQRTSSFDFPTAVV
jgi:hypothetical protein